MDDRLVTMQVRECAMKTWTFRLRNHSYGIRLGRKGSSRWAWRFIVEPIVAFWCTTLTMQKALRRWTAGETSFLFKRAPETPRVFHLFVIQADKGVAGVNRRIGGPG